MVDMTEEQREKAIEAVAKAMADVMIEFHAMGFDLDQMIDCDYFIDRLTKVSFDTMKIVMEE